MGFLETMKAGLAKTRSGMSATWNAAVADFTGENEEIFDDLEEMLILSDAGVDTAGEIIEKLRDRVWVKGDMLTAVIGQSDNRFTPMQLAVYTATLANKGVRNKATFMSRVVSSDYQTLLAENTPKQVAKLNMKQSTIDAYMDGMYQVVNKYGGTAYKKTTWSNVPATVAGKTGTAQQFWGASDNGAFVCFAPYEDPEIAIAVYIEKGGHGSTLTSIARAILQEYYNVGTVSDVTVAENGLS